ncbi:MAG: DUF2779 domain-containing protein [Bacteroidota bacterium]
MKNMITKELFLKLNRCSRAAYLNAKNPELVDDSKLYLTPGSTNELSEEFHKILLPGIPTIKGGDLQEMEARTSEICSKKRYAIKNAVFITKDNEVAIINCIQKGGKVSIWEFNTTSTEIYHDDFLAAAYQYYVLAKCGIQVDNFQIVRLNPKFVNQGNYNDLYDCADAIRKCRLFNDDVKNDLGYLKKVLNYNSQPIVQLGYQCFEPFQCEFHRTCFNEVKPGSVFELNNITYKQKIRAHGVNADLKNIPKWLKLSPEDDVQVEAAVTGESVIRKEYLSRFLEKLNGKRLIFLDLLTVRIALPSFINTKPFSLLPYHFALRRNINDTNVEEHFTINTRGKYDTRKELIDYFISRMGAFPDAKIIVWNADSFKSHLTDFNAWYPEYSDAIDSIKARTVGLMKVFKENLYYDSKFRGRTDLWTVAKTIAPEVNKKDLIVVTKRQAQETYYKIKCGNTKSITTHKVLLNAYSTFEASAMQSIVQFLKEKVNHK